jgi:hypothetical protein
VVREVIGVKNIVQKKGEVGGLASDFRGGQREGNFKKSYAKGKVWGSHLWTGQSFKESDINSSF